jgi:hypothetical protein
MNAPLPAKREIQKSRDDIPVLAPLPASQPGVLRLDAALHPFGIAVLKVKNRGDENESTNHALGFIDVVNSNEWRAVSSHRTPGFGEYRRRNLTSDQAKD